MKTFEELPVWQAGRELVRHVYALTRKSPFRNDPGLCDQIQRAAVSIPSNIAEGHERGTTPDLIQFLFYAKGSAGEVRSQLYHVEDLGYAPAVECERLRQSCRSISRQISAWIQSMQRPGVRQGPKYHRERAAGAEVLLSRFGMERLPDGRFQRKTEEGIRND
jgi:four helix bundle protein